MKLFVIKVYHKDYGFGFYRGTYGTTGRIILATYIKDAMKFTSRDDAIKVMMSLNYQCECVQYGKEED